MTTEDHSFKSYVENRLKARKSSLTEVCEAKNSYIECKIQAILGELGLGKDAVMMTTIRVASSNETTYLRPVYADPLNTVNIARDLSANKNFTYQSASKHLKKENVLNGIDRTHVLKGTKKPFHYDHSRFAALDFVDNRVSKEDGVFTRRIDAVSDDLEQLLLDRPDACFFCVRASKNDPNYYRATHILAIYLKGDCTEVAEDALKNAYNRCQALFDDLDAIMALDSELFKLEGNAVVADVQPVFFNPDLAPADKIAFMIERLKQLLQGHLELHHVKERDAGKNAKKGDDGSTITVRYVSLAYEANDDGRHTPIFQIYPHVYREKYPYPALRISHPAIPSVSKFLLYHYFSCCEDGRQGEGSNRRIVFSTTAVQEGVQLSDSFKDVFDKDPFFRNIVDIDNRQKLFGATEADYIHVHEPITMDGTQPDQGQLPPEAWNALNVVVDAGRPNKATVAFVIEGDVVHHSTEEYQDVELKRLPRAIVAIESPDIDFLSKSERETVRGILIHMSALIRHLFHDNSLLDYRKKLSKAYWNFVPAKASGNIDTTSLLARLLLCAMSIDVEVLGKLLEQMKAPERRLLYLTPYLDEFYEKLKPTIINDDDIGDDKIVKDSIETRLNLARRYIDGYSEHLRKIRKGNQPNALIAQKRYAEWLEDHLEQFIVFLEACPCNFAWTGYSPSLAEALGDRAESAPPDFSLIAPGFSAAGLYMAVVKDEIQQVAKLSSVAKLKSELGKYKSHVRYKIVAAARTPTSGLAFDTTGKKALDWIADDDKDGPVVLSDEEQKRYDEIAYGVLISDLAAAEMSGTDDHKTVRTLLNQIATLTSGRSPVRGISFGRNCRAAVSSIDRLFRISTKLWRTGVKLKEDSHRNTIDMLEKTFRLERTAERYPGYMDGQPESGLQYDREPFPLDRRPVTDAMRRLLNFESYNKVFFDENNDDPSMYAIVHGDLNARNLAWSAALEHYILIDFEHTDIGIWGSDQARLIINLLVDLYSGISVGEDSLFHESIDATCDWVKTVWKQYGEVADKENTCLIKVEKEFSKKIEDWPDDGSVDIDDSITSDEAKVLLKGFIAKILLSFYHHDGNEQSEKISNSTKWNRTMRAMLEMAILKEFEYSVINVKRAKLNIDQINAVNALSSTFALKDILRELYGLSCFKSPERSDGSSTEDDLITEQKRAVARYFISYNLLYQLCLGEQATA